jgi:hypothetical protein
MNSIGVKLPISQQFGQKSINLHHFGTKYTSPYPIRRTPIDHEKDKINRSIEKQN